MPPFLEAGPCPGVLPELLPAYGIPFLLQGTRLRGLPPAYFATTSGNEIINYLPLLSYNIPVYIHGDFMSLCVTGLLFPTSMQLPYHAGTGPILMG